MTDTPIYDQVQRELRERRAEAGPPAAPARTPALGPPAAPKPAPKPEPAPEAGPAGGKAHEEGSGVSVWSLVHEHGGKGREGGRRRKG